MNPNFYPEFTATAIFTLADGGTVTLDNVNVDSISAVGANKGVISVEFENDLDRIVHIPFVRYWEIDWR